ncbi:MAG: cellobiose phosphorylase, partial [Candidatus Omnitrophota bacterium]|nr:cellobiose phosphorylase [Candidatus Omnitrophota bacterium]
PGKSCSYIILMGITEKKEAIKKVFNKFNSVKKVSLALKDTQAHWINAAKEIDISTGDPEFENWFRWVSIQPGLRRIFGCSFLPDFDYGKGGRGWRDLWQDCLGLILSNPQQARRILINNFAGARIDGSNATIIGRNTGEFIADRNNISRVWTDHGVWPLLTLNLYLNETADYRILFEQRPYFRDHQLCRAAERDVNWRPQEGQMLKTKSGKIYRGTILEHLLVQNLVQFFNVGAHNHLRLEGGDWNDGLDMAKEKGESVPFSSMYAHNLNLLAQVLLKSGKKEVELAAELQTFLAKINYASVSKKLDILKDYFRKTSPRLSGKKNKINSSLLAGNLREKSHWMAEHIRRREWLSQGFFNGYYDNRSRRVEGRKNNRLKLMLASQVFPIMGGVATEEQIALILKNVGRHLFDKKFKGYHLNTDFKEEEPHLGRAFSFVYGDKENGAFFNQMIVMFAYALYERGFVKEGWQALVSIYKMAMDTERSKIYPCLPEYFNAEGQGMYSYLTGSASWFVLTLLTGVFGVKGKDGDLLIEPKLWPGQFKGTRALSIRRPFAGRFLQVNFSNPQRQAFGRYKITGASLNGYGLKIKKQNSLLISRKIILRLPQNKLNRLDIKLG